MNLVFANCSEENAVYPLTTWEIAESQSADAAMGQLKHHPGYAIQLVKNTTTLCKDGNLVIPKAQQDRAVAWYHHYLQHPGSNSSCRDSVQCDVLEGYAKYHLITCQKVLQLSGEQTIQ
jgi:hypothetical protein